MKIIDISIPIEDTPSELLKIEVNFVHHEAGSKFLCNYFGCNLSDIPEGKGSAAENLRLSSHSGTHIDDPYHYFPTAEGKKAKTIDELPLEWFFNDGVVLDMRQKPNGSIIKTTDIKECLNKIKYKIKPMDIILIQTGADKLWGNS
ncbi:MAG: cyclase family protein [Dehalococcoidales bacterium]|nr:cyclase family protein [Dehalococcoidales bacterium]